MAALLSEISESPNVLGGGWWRGGVVVGGHEELMGHTSCISLTISW